MVILRLIVLALCIVAAMTFWVAGGFLNWVLGHPRLLLGGLNPFGAIQVIHWVSSQGQKLTVSVRMQLGHYVGLHHPAVFNRLERIFTA